MSTFSTVMVKKILGHDYELLTLKNIVNILPLLKIFHCFNNKNLTLFLCIFSDEFRIYLK